MAIFLIFAGVFLLWINSAWSPVRRPKDKSDKYFHKSYNLLWNLRGVIAGVSAIALGIATLNPQGQIGSWAAAFLFFGFPILLILIGSFVMISKKVSRFVWGLLHPESHPELGRRWLGVSLVIAGVILLGIILYIEWPVFETLHELIDQDSN